MDFKRAEPKLVRSCSTFASVGESIILGGTHYRTNFPYALHIKVSAHLAKHHTGKCIRRFAGIYAYCLYFIDRKW